MIDPPKKSQYKEAILTKVTAFYEAELRSEAAHNSCKDYLNVSVTGLRGRHHPALSCLFTTEQVNLADVTSKCFAANQVAHLTVEYVVT